ncbi:MAG: hypothetical protein ABS900_03005 [Candidatus Limivicinus sp.]
MKTTQQFTAKEWNVSGAFQFYGSSKPRSFIVEVSAAEPIDGALLQQAVDKTVKRMPYYLQTFVRKKGLYYYADNDLPLLVAESERPRVIGGAETNYHMIDVTYSGTWIRFAMFHGLCDGLGLNRFIEATLYHYFCAKDGKEYSDEGIITDKVPFDPEETADGFIRDETGDLKELKKLAHSEPRIRLPELETGRGPLMYRYPLRIKTETFLDWAKSVSASPATAISAILGQSIHRELPEAEGVVMAVVPISLRKYLHVEKSFKNCASAAFLPMKPEECDGMTAGELAAKLRTDLKGQMNEEWALLLTQSIRLLTQLGKKLPFYFLKNKVMAIAENKPQDTVTIDYVGGLRTNDYSDRVTEVRYLNPDVYHGSMFVVLSETAGYFHINFNQTFESKRYFNAFLKGLDELQIPYETLPGDTYLNPVVELPQEQW